MIAESGYLEGVLVPDVLLPRSLEKGGSALNPCTSVDVAWNGEGRVTEVSRSRKKASEDWMALPALVDMHTHLDKAHTWNRAPNRSGTFEEAIEALGRDKVNWTAEDVERRADFALRQAYAGGTGALRSHVDTGYDGCEEVWAALSGLGEKWKDKIAVQLVSLCAVSDYSTIKGEGLADLPIKYGASALGGMPLMSPTLESELDRMLALAEERGLGLDLHVDESGDAAARCLRAIAEAVLRNEFPYPVFCGHCCSLAVQEAEAQRETIALVKESGVGIVSLPLCNLYLQDRRRDGEGDGWSPLTPAWRGITLLRDFLEAEVPVACASDNVRDAFYAFGSLDMYEVFQYSLRLGHLDADLGRAIEVVTRRPAEMMGLQGYGAVEPGAWADFLLLRGGSYSEVLSSSRPVRRFIRRGREESREAPDFGRLDPLRGGFEEAE